MVSYRALEGTGKEVGEFVRRHPDDRFQLILLSESDSAKQYGPGSSGWEEMMQVRRSLKGKMGSLPLEATSTDSLYD